MKNLLLIIALTVSAFTSAQFHKNYTWQEKPLLSKLAIEEAKEPSVAIFEKYTVEFAGNPGNYSVFETTHSLVRVNDERGIQQQNKVYIPMYSVKNIVDIKARTISPNGAVKLLDANNIKEVQNVEEYGDFKIFAIEGVQKGSEIEVLYTVEKEFYPFGSETLQKDYPIKKAEFTLIYGNLNARVKPYFTNASLTEQLIGGKAAKKLLVENLPAMVDEEYATPNANKISVAYQCFAPGVNLTDEMLWNNVVNNVADGFFPEEVSKSIALEADAVSKEAGADMYQRALLLDDYIKNNFNVIKNNNEQLGDVEYIVKTRTASAIGIAKLYAHFLKAMNIEYEAVITANRFETKFDPDFFNPSVLREFLIYLPELKQYISPDRIEYRLGEAPFNILGNNGLFINKNLEYSFYEIDQVDPNFSRIVRNIDINIPQDFSKVNINQYQEYYGHWAVTNRAILALSDEGSKKEFEDYLTSSGIENKTVTGYQLLNSEMLQKQYNTPFVVKSSITSESMLQDAGDTYIFEIGKVIGTQSELYQEKTRINPVEMQYPNKYNYTITLAIPEGYKLDGLESLKLSKSLKPNGELLCSFTSDYTLENEKLTVTIEEIYAVNKFPKEYYDGFREVINAASDFNKASVLLTPKG